MNKILLSSRIKRLIFMLKSSIEYNILPTTKKASKLSFWTRLQIFVLMVSMLAFDFKIIRPTIFSNFSTVKEFFLDQEIFPQSRNFSLIKEFFHSQGIFP